MLLRRLPLPVRGACRWCRAQISSRRVIEVHCSATRHHQYVVDAMLDERIHHPVDPTRWLVNGERSRRLSSEIPPQHGNSRQKPSCDLSSSDRGLNVRFAKCFASSGLPNGNSNLGRKTRFSVSPSDEGRPYQDAYEPYETNTRSSGSAGRCSSKMTMPAATTNALATTLLSDGTTPTRQR